MRISLILLFVFALHINAERSYSQSAKISLDLKNSTIEKVLQTIEEKSDYYFLYSNRLINVDRTVTVKVENAAISSVLDRLFSSHDVEYEVKGSQIILSPKGATEVANRVIASKQQKGKTITGKVVDAQGEPIIGANVIEKGTTNGTVTDVDGNFSLNVANNAVLRISYIGYLEQEVATQGRNAIHVTLMEDTELLDEVVVVGYGVQRKKDLTGSVANIRADKLNIQSNANIGQALQGKIAGVEIVSQGGSPGSGTRVMVRGIGTLNNAAPLYIVDGMYMDGIDHINPNDIASIDVLKDASSAAIYGSRAANGVVIVSTKEGTNTEGVPKVDLSVNFGVTTPTKYLNMLDATGWAEVTTVSRAAIGKPILDMATDLANKPNNDWQRLMLKPAVMQNYNASIKGGGKYTTFYTGLGYFDQDGTVKGTNYKRYTLQSRNEYKRGIFTAGTNLVLTMNEDIPLHSESRGGMLGVILQSIPTLEKYDANNVGGYGGSYGDVTNLPHPLAMVDKNIMDRHNENQRIYTNLYTSLELYKGLKYKINFAPDFSFRRYRYFQGKYDFGLNTSNRTQVTEEQWRTRNMLVEHLITYDQTFGTHRISALAGYTYQDSQYRYLQAYGENLPDGLKEVDAAATARTNSGNSSRSVLTSVLGRIFYSYNNKYLVTATIRRDGSSKFGVNNRYGYFPSVSAGWNVSEESFMKNFEWLDQLKFRGGYGILGNQEIGNYQYSSNITTGINYPDGKGGLILGAFPKFFANPDIRWEETAMTNIGLDFVALNNRLTLTADWYVKDTKDILLNVPIPISTGGANDPIRNAGKIRNRGVEFNLGWNDQISKDFSYEMSFIGSFNKNKVVELGTGTQDFWGGATNQNINTSRTIAGYPIGGYWLIPANGYFNSEAEVEAYSKDGIKIQPAAKPGDIKFVDTNDDGTINDADRVYSGSPFPTATYALNGSVRYKQFDVSIGLQGVAGNKIYNATRQTLEDATKGTNFLASTLDYWTPQNQNSAHPRLSWDDPNRNTRAESNRYLESGNYFRLRNIQLGYTIPTQLFSGVIENVRIFFNAENLFTITNYSGYSPDVNAGGATYRGFDNFIYPNNRVLMLGINATF